MTTVRYSGSSNMTQFRADSGLSDNQIAQYAPSIMADSPHHSRGERYRFISTAAVLHGLRGEGFLPVEVRQTRTRKEDRRDFTKHLVRFRHPHALANKNGDTPEIVLVNSHDGTSSYRLFSGYFRMICSNGLIAGDITNDIKIRHSGKVVDDVIEGAFRVIDDLKQVTEVIDEYQSIQLNQDERLLLADTARELRWGEGERAPVETVKLLTPRRFEDRKDDLWTAFNVVQENLMKGGVAGKTVTGRNMSTRAVNSVTEDVKLNRALWMLADRFAALKTGSLDPSQLQREIERAGA